MHPGPTTRRAHKQTKLHSYHSHAEGLVRSHAVSPAVGLESVSSHEHRSAVSVVSRGLLYNLMMGRLFKDTLESPPDICKASEIRVWTLSVLEIDTDVMGNEDGGSLIYLAV